MGQQMSNPHDEPTNVGDILTAFFQRFLLFAGGLACVVTMSRFSLSVFESGGLVGAVLGLLLAGMALLGVWITILAFVPWQRAAEPTQEGDDEGRQTSRTCGYCHRRARETDVQCASCGANLR